MPQQDSDFIRRDTFQHCNNTEANRKLCGIFHADPKDLPGTVEVRVGHNSRRLPAFICPDGAIIVKAGLFGTYLTSTKKWNAIVVSNPGEQEYCNYGRDDRSGRFNKKCRINFSDTPPEMPK